MKFTQLAKSLKEGLAPVYVIEGEEAYFRDSAVAAIRSACALQNPMLNDARYEGENLKGEGLAALVRDLWTLPFLDERRLVRACEFYPTEREWEGTLKAYCAAPCPSTVFLIVNGGKKAGAAQLSRKAGVVYVDCSREDEETLSRWLFGVARRAGLVMDADAAQLVAETIHTAGERKNVVLLLHDSAPHRATADALPEIIRYFRERGYRFSAF